MLKVNRSIRGVCGEHFVAAYLSGMGLVVGVTSGGAPATDLFATSESGKRTVSLQVKTGGISCHDTRKKKPENSGWKWPTKTENSPSPSRWYAFVFAGDWPVGKDFPRVFFVPSETVAQKGLDPEISESWFWISEVEAEQYEGENGYALLAKALA